MFNSVARYLWGGVEDETDYADRPEPDSHMLETSNSEDGDWVLVENVDKENCCQSAHSHRHNHHHYFHHHASVHQHQPHSPSDPLGSQSHGSCDTELLDDAASLAHHLAIQSNKSSRVPTPECRFATLELDSVDSSDLEENGIDSGVRPSSPESVFSACSGRSHATYQPKGHGTEAWLVAPPPCFTGSQLCDSEPLTSSPLENLLIEHPSMSVYDSVPSSALPSSHQLFSLTAITDISSRADLAAEEGSTFVEHGESNESQTSVEMTHLAVQRREHPNQAALNSFHLLLKKSWNDKRHEVYQQQKANSKQNCKRQNLVQVYNLSSKKSNRRNKIMHPSGCRASRNCQRLH